MRKKIRFVVTAFGAETVERLCRYCLGTLLAGENRRALEQEFEPIFEVFTQKKDILQLRANQVFQEMDSRGWIKITEIGSKPEFKTHISHWESAAINMENQPEAYLFKLAPDVLFSENSLLSLSQVLRNSPAAVFASWHLRITPLIAERIIGLASERGISSTEMVRLALTESHPLLRAYFRDSERFPVHPENIFYQTEYGCLARVLACTPMVFAPARCKLGWHQQIETELKPGEVAWLNDSLKFLCLSILEKEQYQDWYDGLASFDLMEVSSWWKKFSQGGRVEVCKTPFYFFARPGLKKTADDKKTFIESSKDVALLKKLRDNFWSLKKEEKIERLIQAAGKYEAPEFYRSLCA